ncbi:MULTISPECIES: ankyrin repeat domain-containing protein [unclassified Sphingomonas]|uniref:ankyrin repeat domain-containing protein n=1 Tax=unclassified Sphingomonas TaxID=196159 RepID=UPI00082B274E|nr:MULTISPECIES: ankyrin repeat domain-containing protein [unclassified Sphingomonas]
MLDRIANGRTDLVFEWIAGGGDPGTRVDGASLIGWCAYYGDVSAIRYLLEHGVALTALGANFELNAAAFHGHWRLCEFLIEQGSDPRAALPDTGETPLHAALCSFESIEHERVIAVLIAAGADPNAKTNRGVGTGAFMRHARTRGETPLHRAAAYGTLASIQALVAAGAAIDATDANGDTPLGWASWALRDTPVLQALCFPPHRIHPDRQTMRVNLIGHPEARPPR